MGKKKNRNKGKKVASQAAQNIVQKSIASFGSLSNQIKNNATSTVTKYTYTTPTYTYKGRVNQTDFPEFIEVCKKTQKELIA